MNYTGHWAPRKGLHLGLMRQKFVYTGSIKLYQGKKIWYPWYKANVDILNNIIAIYLCMPHRFLYFQWIKYHHNDLPECILEVINVEIYTKVCFLIAQYCTYYHLRWLPPSSLVINISVLIRGYRFTRGFIPLLQWNQVNDK